jgi:hypothetical protein
MRFSGSLQGASCLVLLDTGADRSFADADWLNTHGLQPTLSATPLSVVTAIGQQVTLNTVLRGKLRLDKTFTAPVELWPLADMLPGVQVILGMDWLRQHAALIDVRAAQCTVIRAGKQHILRAGAPHQAAPAATAEVFGIAALQHLRSDPQFITARQANVLLKRGCKSVLAVALAQPASPVAPPAPIDFAAALPDTAPSPVDRATLLQVLRDHEDVFRELPSGLPPDRSAGHTIRVPPDIAPPFRKMYRQTQPERLEVERQVADLLSKGFIEPSSSPYGAPVLFVQKKDGTLRMCIDYRALNKLTVRDRFPLPRIDDLLDQLAECRVFSSLDLQSGYHQIRIAPEDVEKTAFVTHLGHFQFKVLCFGLTNAPATFQRVMHRIFAPYIGRFVLVYLDDILVMSRTPEEHVHHLRTVLSLLKQHQLYAKLSKCDFGKTHLKFLGHIVGGGSVAVDPDKVRVLHEWPVPRSRTELRSFLGLANYFKRFVPNYSTVAAPLTDLTSEAVVYDWDNWSEPDMAAFTQLKHLLTQPPVLALPDLGGEFTVMSDASVRGCGAVLMQNERVIAYCSRKFTSAERNYTTGEQELLGLITALREWRCYLEGTPVTLVTDHNPLIYLDTQDQLSRRQARWVEFLSRFQYTIVYQRGAINVADPLSRHPAFAACVATLAALTRAGARAAAGSPSSGGETLPTPTVSDPLPPPPDERDAQEVSASLMAMLRRAYAEDPSCRDPQFTSAFESDDEGLWWFHNKIVVPQREELRTHIIREHHDVPWAGHRGVAKTLELVSRQFWWSTLRADVTAYVSSCDACQRNKAGNQPPGGLLQPLPVPDKPWESVSMDMIVKLPTVRGHDSILVFVDRLTKYVHLVPTTEALKAKGFARLFINHVFANHGLPRTLISDRGTVWNNKFWLHVSKMLRVKHLMSTAYHPQTDGQTERTNRTLQDVLRNYVNAAQSDWDRWLPVVQFAINNSWQQSVQATPFYLNSGMHPDTPTTVALPRKVPEATELIERMQTALKAARTSMAEAQKRQRESANKRRRDVEFAVGDRVLLSAKNLKFKAKGARKLMPKFVGPFTITERVGKSAYRLQLPPEWLRVHDVFNVSLLRPYNGRPGQDVFICPPPANWVEDQPEWEVEAIIDHRLTRSRGGESPRVSKYLVRWKGWSPEHDSWETVSNLSGAPDVLSAYKATHGLSEST